VSKLHNHRRKYKARFNSNVEVISGKLAQFDDRLAEVNAEYTMLFDQVDTIHHVDIPDIQTQLGGLQERVDELPDLFSTPDPGERTPQPGLHERDVKTNIWALESLVDGMFILVDIKDLFLMYLFLEMRLLRETSQAQMAAEIEAIKVMRETAMADIAQAQAQAAKASQVCSNTSKVLIEQRFTPSLTISQTPVLLSLKRKRDDTDENEEADENENIQQAVDIADVEGSIDLANQDKDVVVVDEDVSAPSTKPDVLEAAAGTHRQLDAPPPRKRTRRIGSVLAHTATAVTIGAVVTWSALAFS
jgi:hypothetical protein